MKNIYYATLFAVILISMLGAVQNEHTPQPVGDQCWSEMQAAMAGMHQAMKAVTPSADCDRDFVRLMLPHHQAAIDMAKAQLLHGRDPAIRRLAQEIITDQRSEIELMQLWQQKRKAAGLNPGDAVQK